MDEKSKSTINTDKKLFKIETEVSDKTQTGAMPIGYIAIQHRSPSLSVKIRARATRSQISALGGSMAPCHPAQAIMPTGYLSKINSYGRARVPLRASTVGGAPRAAPAGGHARVRATRSQISARGGSMAPCHPAQAIIPTGYLSKIDSYGRARVPLRASTV